MARTPRSVRCRMSRPRPCCKREDRERDLIVGEGIAAARLDRFDSGGRDRIARRGKRQLVDDDAAERVAHDVHTLPEAGGREQHGIRCRAELLDQRRPRRRALHEDRKGNRHLDELLDRAQHRVAGEEDERAAARSPENFDHLARGRRAEVRRLRRSACGEADTEAPAACSRTRTARVPGWPRGCRAGSSRTRTIHRRRASPTSGPSRACGRTAPLSRGARRRSATRAGRVRGRGSRRNRRSRRRWRGSGTSAPGAGRAPAAPASRGLHWSRRPLLPECRAGLYGRASTSVASSPSSAPASIMPSWK